MVLEVTPKPPPEPKAERVVDVLTPVLPGEDEEEAGGPADTSSEVPGHPKARGEGRLGVRAGVSLTGSGDYVDYEPNLLLGVHYLPGRGTGRGNGSKLDYELALGFGWEEEEGGYESRTITGDLNVRFALGDAGAKARGYLLSGLGATVEPVVDLASGESYTNYAGMLSVGGGYAFGGGRFDARLVCGVLLGSENVAGRAHLSFGYGF